MPDISITTEQLTRLAPVLTNMAPLSPPPSAAGRYVAIRATEKTEKPFLAFATAERELMNRCAIEGSIKPNGQGQVTFTVKPELLDDYTAQRTALLAEPVVLSGLRPITRAELGECPITIQQDRVLVECGLLDAMPDISP